MGGPRRTFALAAAATALSGCQFFFPTPIEQEADTRPSAAAHAFGEGFFPGETIKSEVYLDGVVAGVGELAAGAPCLADGRKVVPVTTTGRSAGIIRMFQSASSDVRSLLDAETSLPIEAAWDVKLGERGQQLDQLFSEGSYRFKQIRKLPEKPPRTSFGEIVLPMDGTPHDGHSSLGFMRNWDPAAGTRGHLYAVYGRYLWRADLTYRGVEIVSTPLGTQRAGRVDGLATKLLGKSLKPSQLTPTRPFTMWISADERRVPLRILLETALAKVTIDTVGYERDAAAATVADPPPACAPRVDAAAVEKGVARKRQKEEERKKKDDEARASGAEPENDDERDEKEDREALEKILKR